MSGSRRIDSDPEVDCQKMKRELSASGRQVGLDFIDIESRVRWIHNTLMSGRVDTDPNVLLHKIRYIVLCEIMLRVSDFQDANMYKASLIVDLDSRKADKKEDIVKALFALDHKSFKLSLTDDKVIVAFLSNSSSRCQQLLLVYDCPWAAFPVLCAACSGLMNVLM